MPEEAEVVYVRDLHENPDNGYSLIGLRQSFEAQKRGDEASRVDERLKRAWAHADVELSSSRY